MLTYVWVSAWQQQCCGPNFGLGSNVTWQVVPSGGEDHWITTLLGPDWGDAVRYVEDHHETEPAERLREVHGVVRSIRVITCDRVLQQAPAGGPDRPVWMPVPGSGRLRQVELADPWEPEQGMDGPEQSFDGWIVELEIDHEPAG